MRLLLCGLTGLAGTALADGIYMTNMKTALTPASISMLTNSAHAAGAQAGDIVEFVLSATVANAPGGPGVYFTAYLAPGLTVLGASFVTDATGTTLRAPGAAGRAHDGWGPRGSKTPFGAPFVGVLNGRQNDVYGDTGVFYSTDARTRLFTSDASNIARGPIGNPTSSSGISNGYNVTDTFYKDIGAFNLWDANQVNAFGAGGALGSVPVNAAPTSSAVVINSIGQGVPPFGAGSSVAGPQTGYMLDNTGSVGPWQRIRTLGSFIADISDGPALAVGTADTPTVLDASGLGLSVSDGSPLGSATNAVRWADGFHALADTVFVKIRVRVDAPVLLASDGVIANFEATGSDNWASGSKDNPWRYFGPTVAESAVFNLRKDIVSVNGAAYAGGVVPAGATLTYRIRYMNLGNLPINVSALIDKLPVGVSTLACSVGTPTVSGATAGVSLASVSAGTTTCPAASATLTFGNLPNVVGGRLGALRGGEFSYQVKLASTLVNGTAVTSLATLSGTDVVSAAPASQTAAANATIGVVVAATPAIDVVMAQGGAVTQINATTFDVPYSVVLSNTGTVSSANVQVNSFLPTAFATGSPTVTVNVAPSLQSGACVINAAFDGDANTALLAGSDTLAVGQSCTVRFSAHVVYPSASAVPAAAQNNSAFASSAAAANSGYSFPAGVATAPAAALATDVSTNSSTPPATVHADTPSPTPVFLPKLVGFESVKLSTDADASGTPTAGDTLTWTIVYANTGGVAVGGFQINDLLPAGVSLAGSPNVLAAGVGTAATANLSYSGITGGAVSNLLAAGATCAPGCVITVNVPVTINPAFVGTVANQASATGTGLPAVGINSDNVDSSSSGLPNGISVPPSSITQVQTAAIDATTVNVVAAPVGLLISGTVFNDSNGLSDGLINGVGTQAGSSMLTAYLVAGGQVVASSTVAANGHYVFANVAVGSYSVVLSNSAGVAVGAAAPAASLPAAWVNTGEGMAAAGDAQVDGSTAVTVAGASISGVNFGIEQPPVAGTVTLAAQVNPGGVNTIAVPAGAFTGALPTGASGSNASDATAVTDIRLTNFPSNVTSLNLGGTNYISFPAGGVTVSVAQLAGISIDPVDGNVSVVLAYVALDAAGQASGPSSVTVPFSNTAFGVSGTVLNDSNGVTDGLINGIGTQAGSSTLTAYLVGSGNVVATSPVAVNGSYVFAGIANGSYSIVLSNTAGLAVGAAAPVASLPAGWVNTGEGTAAAGDAQIDGSTAITVAGASVSGVNFGIEQPPVAGNLSLAAQANTGSTSLLPIPATAFAGVLPAGASGSNASDATAVTDIHFTSFPSNVSSVNVGGTSYTSFPAAGLTFSLAQLGNFSVAPLDGNVTVVIAYVALDAAGQSSGAGSVSVPLNVASFVVSGTVLNDSNGLSDGLINGVGTQAGSSTLTAYLVGAGKVFAASTVLANGSYSFANAVNGDYSIVLSNTAGVAIGAAAPVASLPVGWIHTGEGTAAAGDGQADGSTAITVAGANVSGANFGIEQPPVTGQLTLATQANPGGVNTIAVPAAAFTGTPPAGASGTNSSDATAVTDIRLTSFPSNVTSLHLGGTNYTSFTATGLMVSVAQLAGVNVDPVDGNVNVVIHYVALDAAGQSSGPGSITLPFSDISFSVSGSVLNDSNGLSDGLINGPGTQAGSSTLTAYLVSVGKVVASSSVAGNGSYGFAHVANGDYSVVLSNNAALAVGAAAPAASLPAGWVNTGEGTVAAGDGLVDGSTPITVAGGNVSGVNFGIEQPPVAGQLALASQANPGSGNTVAVPAAAFTGDLPPGATGSNTSDATAVTTIRINSMPSKVSGISVNGVNYTTLPAAGLTLDMTQLAGIRVAPVDGNVTVLISYVALDAAGQSSGVGTVSLPLTGLSVGGTVFNDSNGLSDGFINGPGTQAGSSTLTAYLVSGGNVVAANSVAVDGSYTFANVANGAYTVVLSNAAAVLIGAPAPAPSLPAGWVNTAEGTAPAGDGQPNGSTAISVAGASLGGVNFGIEQPPVAVGATLAAQVNPGHQELLAVPAGLFTASADVAPGVVSAYHLTSFPANTNALVANGSSYSVTTFPALGLRLTLAQLSALAVDPIDGGVTVSLPFRAIDDAGIESLNIAQAQLPLQQPSVGVAMAVMAAPEQIGVAAFAVPYRVVVANPANAPLASNVQVLNNLHRAFRVGGANPNWRIKGHVVRGLAGAVCTVPVTAFDGDAAQALLAGNNSLAPGQACQIDFVVQLDYGSSAVPRAALFNQAFASTATTPNSGGSLPNSPTAAPSMMVHALAAHLSDAATALQLNSLAPALAAADPAAVNDGVPGVPAGGTTDPTPVLLPRLAALAGSVVLPHSGAADRARYLVQLVVPANPADAAAANTLTPYLQAVSDANGKYTIAGVPTGKHLALRMLALAAGSGDQPETAQLAIVPGSAGLPIVATLPMNGDPGVNVATEPLQRGYLPLFIDAAQLPANGVVSGQDLPIDPSGVVYDSITRQPLAGATVQFQLPSGAPVPPGVLYTGSAPSVVTNADGVYSFLLFRAAYPGRYKLQVTPPADYVLSQLIPPTPELLLPAGPGSFLVQAQEGAPVLRQSTRYYFDFNMPVARDVVNNHIPLDPRAVPRLALSKTGDRAVVELLDSLKYTLQVRRSDSGAQTLAGVSLTDRLPAGFKYLPGTLAVNGVKLSDADAGLVGTGPLLNFNAGPLVAGGTLSVSYRVRVGVGAQEGDGINRAWAGPAGVNCAALPSQCSNEARYQVQVSGGVFSRQACVVGKVFVDCNHNQAQDADEPGIPGVRLLLQDGSVVVTDVDGKYSLCGIAPRTQVLKVDGLSLPTGSRLVTSSSRNVGDAQSIFINPIAGELFRADFIEGACSPTVLQQVQARRISVEKPASPSRELDAPALKFNGKASGYAAMPPAPDSPAPPPPAPSVVTQNPPRGQ